MEQWTLGTASTGTSRHVDGTGPRLGAVPGCLTLNHVILNAGLAVIAVKDTGQVQVEAVLLVPPFISAHDLLDQCGHRGGIEPSGGSVRGYKQRREANWDN